MHKGDDYKAQGDAMLWAILVLLVIALGSCVTGVPEADELRAQQMEQERQELFVLWKQLCHDSGGYVLINKSWSCRANAPDCIPHKGEWDGYIRYGQKGNADKLISNSLTYQCTRRW